MPTAHSDPAPEGGPQAALRQLHRHLKSSAALGAAHAGDARGLQQSLQVLSALSGSARVFGRLRDLGQALLDAPASERPLRLLAVDRLCRAVLVAQSSAAESGALCPLSGVEPGGVSARHSSQALVRIRAAVFKKGSGRLAALRREVSVVDDLRLASPMNAALDGPLSELAEELLSSAISGQGWLVDVLEAQLLSGEGSPSGDACRLRLILGAAPPRAWAAARLLLEGKPKAALRAELYHALAADPEALSILLAAARRGPKPCRRAAMCALAGRPEPESLGPILEALSRPSEWGFELFSRPMLRAAGKRPEFVAAAHAGLRRAMEPLRQEARALAALGQRGLPQGSPEAVAYKSALRDCTEAPSPEVMAGLADFYEFSYVRPEDLSQLGAHAPPEVLSRVLPLSWRAGFRSLRDGRLLLLARAAPRLPKARLFELLAGDLSVDFELQSTLLLRCQARAGQAIAWLRLLLQQGPAGEPRPWSPPRMPKKGALSALARMELDGRWMEEAKRQRQPFVVAALVEPGDEEAARVLIEALPAAPLGGAPWILFGLLRAQAPGLQEAAAARLARYEEARSESWTTGEAPYRSLFGPLGD